MRGFVAGFMLLLACSGSHNQPAEPGPGSSTDRAGSGFAQPPPPIDAAVAVDAAAPIDAAVATQPGMPPSGPGTYMSDCSLTNPIAHDPCSGVPASTRGLNSCAALQVKRGQACGARSPACFNETRCADGHMAVSEYLVCADKTPGRCMTRSSRDFKNDIHYVTSAELAELAQQIESLKLAQFRYKDQRGGDPRLGFITEDAVGAPFVSSDGRTVDLYSLLSASIAAIQQQDARIRALEKRLEKCEAP
jgi:hypothetical protein